jgi:16S rRNA (adenine1518-N6/adenine1519-N6)-dimethyltransferase
MKKDKVFLVDEEVLDYETRIANLKNKIVLEIGGGTGNLTRKIKEEGAKFLYVVEKDKSLTGILKNFEDERTKVIEGDFLKLEPFPVDVIIGNIPYSISSKILFKLIEWKFDHAVLCVQKEFAERVVAKPGTKKYGRLSVMTQIYFKPIFLKIVPKGAFRPIPKVDSALIYLSKTNEKVNKERDELIRKLFSHKKKNILSAIKSREFSEEERRKIKETVMRLGLEKKKIFQLGTKEIITLSS